MFFTDKFDQKNFNQFQLSAKSGLITGLSAADVVFAWRWPAAAPDVQWITGIEVKGATVTGYTAAQEVGFDLLPATFGGANYAGGTDLSHPTTAANHAYIARTTPYGLDTTQRASKLLTGNVRISDTAALTHSGSPVVATHPILFDTCADLAAAATVQKGRLYGKWTPPDGKAWGIGADAGFVIKLPIALGTAGTLRLWVSVFFAEG
jgi:hypothetical protein